MPSPEIFGSCRGGRGVKKMEILTELVYFGWYRWYFLVITISTSSPYTMPSITHHHQYIHPLPLTNHHPHPPTPSTSGHLSSTQTVRMGRTTCGTSASPSSYETPITTHPTSGTHGAVTSNIETTRTFSAYKPTQFKPSPTHVHFPSIPPPSGGYFSTSSTCLS